MASTPPPPRRRWLSVLTGTRPGLETFLLVAFPAIVAGGLVGQFYGIGIGIPAGFAAIVVGVLVARRVRRARP